MSLLTGRLPSLIKDRVARVLQYGYSMEAMEKLANSINTGSPRLTVDLVQAPKRRAEEALVELAVYMRAFDDELSYQFQGVIPREWKEFDLGRLQLLDGSERPLTPREMANKVIHAEGRSWAPWGSAGPMAVCHFPIDETRPRRSMDNWISAEIELRELGLLMFHIGG